MRQEICNRRWRRRNNKRPEAMMQGAARGDNHEMGAGARGSGMEDLDKRDGMGGGQRKKVGWGWSYVPVGCGR